MLLLRDRVAPTIKLMLDPASHLRTFADAVAVGRACDEANYLWLEDPFQDTGVSQSAHRLLRERSDAAAARRAHPRPREQGRLRGLRRDRFRPGQPRLRHGDHRRAQGRPHGRVAGARRRGPFDRARAPALRRRVPQHQFLRGRARRPQIGHVQAGVYTSAIPTTWKPWARTASSRRRPASAWASSTTGTSSGRTPQTRWFCNERANAARRTRSSQEPLERTMNRRNALRATCVGGPGLPMPRRRQDPGGLGLQVVRAADEALFRHRQNCSRRPIPASRSRRSPSPPTTTTRCSARRSTPSGARRGPARRRQSRHRSRRGPPAAEGAGSPTSCPTWWAPSFQRADGD